MFRSPRSWSLRARLVVSAVTLIAIVAALIGTVTTIAFRSYLYDQADGQLRDVSRRAQGPPPSMRAAGDPGGRDPLAFVLGPGAPLGTVGAVVGDDGALEKADRSVEVEQAGYGRKATSNPLDEAQSAALATAPRDGRPHTVELPELGDYRVVYVSGGNGAVLVGLPLDQLQGALSALILVTVSVTGAGLVAASLAGGALVGIALRPLRRVAATATQVSELPLHSGEPALHHRVPESDPRTELGQVGAAINRKLDHVHSALHARQQSETRVRQFVADASHELRTPLASIRGYAELTRRGREECGPDTRHALGLLVAGRLDRRIGLGIAGLGLAAGLAGPFAYTLETLSTGHQGSIVTAGPSAAGGRGGADGPGGGGMGLRPPGGDDGGMRRGGSASPQGQGQPQGQAPGQFPGGTPPQGMERVDGRGGGGGGGGMGGLLNGATVGSQAKAALLADADDYTWVAAAIGAQNAASYQLATEKPVMAIGGFNGSDPSPTLAQFKQYVAQGEIHYFIGGSGGGGGEGGGMGGGGSDISAWVSSTFEEVTVDGATLYDLTAQKQ